MKTDKTNNSRIPGILPMALLFMGLMFLSIAGCGQGLPEAVRDDAKNLARELKTAQTHIQNQQSKYQGLAASAPFKPMAPYAQKENWTTYFDDAKAVLSRAQRLYENELAPVIKKNSPEDSGLARVKMLQIKEVVQEARKTAQAPFARMDRIRPAMNQPQSVHDLAARSGQKILSSIQALEQGPVSEAREKFPDAVSEIDSRTALFAKMAKETRDHLKVVEKEYNIHLGAGQTDYGAFITAADAIEQDLKTLTTKKPNLEKQLALLYQSYTKVLQDMKVNYQLTIKRESWNERSDYYNPGFVSFNRQVTPAVYQSVGEPDLETLAEITPGFRGMSLKNNIGPAWATLNINPTENWPDRSHNAASFWVEATKETYFHKYIKEENGETSETGWVKVNPSFYEKNLDNLGMAILSKPYGEFEPDPQAAPPGMAYVGNPQYGEWKKDEKGESFWSWYGRYAFFSSLFFFPPSYYSYGSWNRWHTRYRHQKPYYGRTQTGAYTYGTRGSKVKQSPRYQNTTFAKTGGFKSRPASVRGGSASIRGGGPKAKGK
ncbi:MAG: hypothetical protein HUK40_10605 [Desulfobacter sp.]|nr:hypothetical protein [Desulfobacter sp.]